MSFQTIWAFLAELSAKPLPPQIDRSMLASKSGTDQAAILSALRFFDFVEEDNTVQASLQGFVGLDEAGKRAALNDLVLSRYPDQMAISRQNGTEKLLLDSFEESFGFTGETRRKAATFFLHTARMAGIALSPHFPVTRSGPGAPAGSRAKRTTRRKPPVGRQPTPAPAAEPKAASGDTYTVRLQAGGTVTLIVNVGHFALSKHKTDREFVQGLMDKLTEYGEVEESSDGGDTPEGLAKIFK